MSRDLSPVAQQFDRAEAYETVVPASFQHSGALLVAFGGVLPGDGVLDAAAGSGPVVVPGLDAAARDGARLAVDDDGGLVVGG
jgi:hypothetical protein